MPPAGSVAYLGRNQRGRDFVVGDVHGCFSMLDSALARVGFDGAVDRVIFVGDLVDRGPESERVLDYLLQPWAFACMGNHEAAILAAERLMASDPDLDRLRNGFGAGWFLSLPADSQRAIWQAFSRLPLAIEIDRPEGLVGVVHAELPVWMDWPGFKAALEAGDPAAVSHAIEGRSRIKAGYREPVAGVSRLFVGHTIQRGRPLKMGNVFCIDTGAFLRYRPNRGGKLMVIEL